MRNPPDPFHFGAEIEVDDRAVDPPTQGLLALSILSHQFLYIEMRVLAT